VPVKDVTRSAEHVTMTVSAPLRALRPRRSVSGSASAWAGWADWLPIATVVLAIVGWGITLTHASGGTAPYTPLLAIAATVPALVVGRPWTWVRTWLLVLIFLPGTAALVLNATSATGWQGLDTAWSWLYAPVLGLAVAGYVTTARRRRLVALLLLAVGAEQVGQAWFAWWGVGDARNLMVGTFFWHNPFAAFVAALAVLGTTLAVVESGRGATVAAVLSPWLAAGVVLSGSRAVLVLWALALVTLGLLVVRSARSALRWLVQVLAPVAVVAVLTSRFVMPQTGSGGVGAAARQESAEANFTIRFDYWRAAWQLARRHLVLGTGYDSYAGAGAGFMPVGRQPSAFVHNAVLQALVDGGLLLALPVLAGAGWVSWQALKRVWAGRRPTPDRGPRLGAALAGLLLVVHALFDVDWTYPSLLALMAVLTALLGWPARPVLAAGRRQVGAGLVAAAVVVAAGCSLVASAQAELTVPLARWQRAVVTVLPVRQLADLLPTATAGRGDLAAAGRTPPEVVRRGLRWTARAAGDDPVLAQERALAVVRLGDPATGLAWSVASFPARPAPGVVAARADVLLAAGERAAAIDLVRAALRAGQAAVARGTPVNDLVILQTWLTSAAGPAENNQQPGSGDGATATAGGPGEEHARDQ
jgi:hypothetical protein